MSTARHTTLPGSVTVVPADGAEDTRSRVRRYRATRDRALRDELLLEHRWLAHYCANRFVGRGEPQDDLMQVAQLGMLRAIERYDPDFGVAFAGFAVPTVRGEIKRHFRDATWCVRVPRRSSELLVAVIAAIETLSQVLQRTPTVDELAHHVRTSNEDVLAALEAREAYRTQPLGPAYEGGEARTGDAYPSVDDTGLDPTRITMRLAITELSDDDQRIIYLRFYDGLTQTEIAQRLGTTQVQVSRRLSRIYQRLQAVLERKPADDIESAQGRRTRRASPLPGRGSPRDRVSVDS
jgi:RNA polymerase sigma-B factor